MSTNDGIQNEIQIVNNINNHFFSELNDNLKAFVNEYFNFTQEEKNKETFRAERTNNPQFKPDIIVSFLNSEKYVSVKKGQGNSVHQESIDNFIVYLEKELKASKEVIDSLLFFHWGDGTTDGSGLPEARMKASTIIKKYPTKIATVQSFFNDHVKELLDRFLVKGIHKQISVDIFYYGDYEKADWHTTKEVIDYLSHSEGSALCIGGLKFQNYGRSLNGNDDSRRQYIQIKWPSMTSFFLIGKKSISDTESRIRGDNSHGFRNVIDIVNSINNIKLCKIPNTLKEFIIFIFDGRCTKDSIVNAAKINKGKGDMLVWLSEDIECKKNISIISGFGNSVHQEKVESFCNFLKTKINLSDEYIKEYLLFHFADGTTDNTGKLSDRKNASQYKNEHQEALEELKGILARYSKTIIEHFIKDNSEIKGTPDVDYIFYGNTELPYWAKVDTLIELECKKEPNNRAALAVGDFSIQTWNRSLNGKTEERRLSMQAKWNNLPKSIQEAQRIDSQRFIERSQSKENSDNQKNNKAIEGLNYELKFASEINKDRNHPIWNVLNIKNDNAYIVNVSYNQISKLACAKVNPKSDCYAVTISSGQEINLEKRNYVLSEEYLIENNIKFDIISDSGISVKMYRSKNFTYQKISFNAFKNMFKTIASEYFVAALLYVDVNQLEKNSLIFSTFNTNLGALCKALDVDLEQNELNTYKSLKHKAIVEIEKIVNNDINVRNMICFGDEVFEPPYVANYIYASGELLTRDSFNKKITVTTGSGRSSGNYTLAFK